MDDSIPNDSKSVAAEPNSTAASQTTVEKEQGSQPTVDWEKRYKDTQKSIQERSLENKQLKAKNEALAKQLSGITTTKVEVPEEVEALMYTDPQAWRREINKLEQEAKAKDTQARDEILTEASKAAAEAYELDRRTQVLKEFQADNPDLKITDEVLKNDIPPSISNKLADGTSTFEQFLEEVKTFVSTGNKPSKEPLMDEPNLSKQAGGEQPSIEAQRGDASTSYANEIY